MKRKLAPQQPRSRASEARLLKATRELLQEKGLKGTTVPRIAARAGLTPGAVYRRFPDKEALLRTVILATLEQSNRQLETALTPELAQKYPMEQMAGILVNSMLASYRQNTGFLRAVREYWLAHPSAAFRRKVDELESRNLRRMVDFLLRYREHIRRPDPAAAIAFGLALVSFTLNELILMEILTKPWDPLLPQSDQDLVRELTRSLLNAMGVEPGP